MAIRRADTLIQERLFQNLQGQAATARMSGRSRGRSPVKWAMPWSGKADDHTPRTTKPYRAPRDLRVRDHSGSYTTRVIGAHHQQKIVGDEK